MKLCHMMCHKVDIIPYIQLLRGTAPLKLGRAKNVQNLAQFRTTINFDHEYLRNRSRYQKQETNFIENNPCGAGQKWVNFGTLTKKL